MAATGYYSNFLISCRLALIISNVCYGVGDTSKLTERSVVGRFRYPSLSATNKEPADLNNGMIDNTIGNLQNLAYNGLDALYVGGTNYLAHLNSKSFELKKSIKTGPELDSPFCNYNGDCTAPSQSNNNNNGMVRVNNNDPAVNKTLTNNYNQLLILHPADGALITCGTVKQGVCEMRLLADIEKVIVAKVKPVAVAANGYNATTVGFVGPGPSNSTVLYVGAAYTYETYRSDFPAVCSRSLRLDRAFQLEYDDVTSVSAMIVRNENRADFRVWYVYGFYSDGFAYWAAVQKQSLDHGAPYASKLLRVCSEDSRYESYSEIPLECKGPDNVNYNILKSAYVGRLTTHAGRDDVYLVGVFVKGEYPSMTSSSKIGSQSASSAVCLYSLKEIRSAFWYNIERCSSGLDYWNLPQFGLTQKCMNFTSLPQDYCHHVHVGGSLPAISIASITYPDTVLTAVTMGVVDGRTVLLLGTAAGRIKKIRLESGNVGKEYSELTLGDSSINADIFMDKDGRHFYAMNANEVFKVKLEDCSSFSTCDSCLKSEDPFCGWCTLENRCSTRKDCFNVDKRDTFLASGQICPRIDSMQPLNASLYDDSPEASVLMQFNILPVPPDDGGYRCIFNNEYVSADFLPPKGLRCNFPSAEVRPRAPEDSDHVIVDLKIWSSVSNAVFHETRFPFYNCAYHQLCTSCVASRWPCDWCLQDNKCIHDSNACSNNQVLIRHEKRQHVSYPHAFTKNHSMPSFPSSQCPHIDSHVTREILLPHEYAKEIKVAVVNLDKLTDLKNDTLLCISIVEGQEVRVSGRLSIDRKTVTCDDYMYAYSLNSATSSAKFRLQTKSGTVIDRLNVQLYKCHLLAEDCSRCFSLDPGYGCTWCDNKCTYRSSCLPDSLPNVETASSVCPPPEIYSVEPSAGPLEGGTFVEILGRDLGCNRREVTDKIFLADVACQVVEYELAKRIVCVTEKSVIPKSGPVKISLDSRRKSESDISYGFVNPVVESFSPNKGPKSGGTRMSISGRHLLDAADVRVYLGNLPCTVERRDSTSNTLFCTTGESPMENLIMDGLTVVLDKANRTLRSPYTYTPDPRISSITPTESFKSGGRQLFVRGEFFTSIQKPLMFIVGKNGLPISESSICHVYGNDSTLMICPSPPMFPSLTRENKYKRSNAETPNSVQDTDDGQTWQYANGETYDVGFLMDNVTSVLRLPARFGLKIYPNPVYYVFQDGKKLHRGETLILEGRHLHLANTKEEVSIRIAGEVCNVTSIAPTQVMCQMPKRSIGDVVTETSQNPMVIVKVGNLAYELGRLVFDTDVNASTSIDAILIGSLTGGCLTLMLLLIVGAAFWWRRKSGQTKHDYEMIKLQMDNLESKVRQECKQAFAELQTDMSDLTGDLLPLNIPYHDRCRYAAKIMFKEEHQAALQIFDYRQCSNNGYSTSLQSSLGRFELLLGMKEFVLIFVNCLEHQSTFSAQDRVYVGSLLTASLLKNMQYLTDIVVSLLRLLIRRTAVEKHPQLMLRRTESVVEKMLANWIALCLYDYLQEIPGQSLFLLFKAMKHQVEKGPVDAVTADARYSLSEDRLLKEVLDSEPVLLRVIPNQCDVFGGETVLCRVLNCDTISQVKSKIFDTIYRNAPFSSRPSIYDYDLEWREHGGANTVLLSDDDYHASPPCKEGWRHLRTVQCYNLPNHAIVAVLPKSRESFSYSSNGSTHTYASISSSTYLLSNAANNGCSNGSSAGRRSPPENLEHPIRYWHLIKPEDSSGHRGGSIPEIYLTRLLATKGTVKQFIDDFFGSALRVGPGFPLAVKYLFDVLHDEALKLGINEPSVVYAWKNNSLPLRFWVNIIKNPDFVFDVEKSSTVDACLSVVAQTFMDSCSAAEQRLGKDSPSNKLLFARDSAKYRELFGKFYSDVQDLSSVSEQDLNTRMAELSRLYETFNATGSVRELFAYAVRYKEQIYQALKLDERSQQFRLAERFEQCVMISPPSR